MQTVESEAIRGIGYREANRELIVRFVDGGLYAYKGVAPAVQPRLPRRAVQGPVLPRAGCWAAIPTAAWPDAPFASAVGRLIWAA
ncbi:MAG: KTSC domain-containing protein [Caulobacteraceae bacterium]